MFESSTRAINSSGTLRKACFTSQIFLFNGLQCPMFVNLKLEAENEAINDLFLQLETLKDEVSVSPNLFIYSI